MSNARVILPLLLALLVAGLPCTSAVGQMPTAYPTTGSPAFSIPNNSAYQPTAAQTPSNPYVASSQMPYSSYPTTGEQQVACYSAPCAPAGCATGDCAGQEANPYATSADSPCTAGPAMCCTPAEAVWVAYAGGMVMNIDEGHHYTFSYDNDNIERQYTDWRNDNIEWAGGFEVALRRFDACCCTGWEISYWGIFPDTEVTSTYDTDFAGDLNPILDWSAINYDGATGDNYTNDATVHRLSRDVEIHNAEINHIVLMSDNCGMPWRGELLCGFRFFKYDDSLQFMSQAGVNDPIYYDVDTQNNLFGVQVGGWGEYQFGCRWSVAGGAKVGVYENHIKTYNRIGGAAGTATVNGGPNDGRTWRVACTKDDVSLLGELQLNLLYQLTPCWRAGLGYRVVGVTGVATPTDQIYHDLHGLQDVEMVDSHGSLFLHGFTASIERQF